MGVIIIIFILGYAAIAFEQSIHINKAAVALLTGIICWTLYIFLGDSKAHVVDQLTSHLGELSQILFFLMGAMTIVELIDAHNGFDIISRRIKTTSSRRLLWLVALLTFVLSSILNNLTTAIVMISLVRKLMGSKKERIVMAGIIIIAANAGGVWSPIGDVTTTMLWIGGQVTPAKIAAKLILPSLVSWIVPVSLAQIMIKGSFKPPEENDNDTVISTDTLHQKIVLFSGITIILLVPIFQAITTLPPVMGILIGLAIIWIVT